MALPEVGTPALGRRGRLLLLGLVAAVFLVYQPAWRGGLLWDDDAHITRPELRRLEGLRRIWCEPRATQQYYPLLHSFFWLQYQFWGEATPGYHFTNIALHALTAVLAAMLLRRLAVPGAYLAAALFALHPVQVESVAWISEQKNTLSALFYLAAALMYLRFDQTRQRLPYVLAWVLFVLGLLSKTVTATLPAAMLVVFWWRRRRLCWRRDVLPLVPFFLLGVAAGVLTAWVERKLIGAEGAEYNFTLLERLLIAGRVIWFYLGKLFWPAELIFIYPRWTVSQAVWWQYLFPGAAWGLLALSWAVRRRTRAPLAGLLFFVGTLFPVLGFFNIYPFRYSLVADHFQYLASLGMIVLAAAGATLLLARGTPRVRRVGQAVCLALVLTLAILSWRQSRMYGDIETLYRATIARNPACSIAYNNLGLVLVDLGRSEEAIEHFHKAARLNPDNAEAYNNLGYAMAAKGNIRAAIEHYHDALRIKPNFFKAHNNLANALATTGNIHAAIEHYREALRLKPDDADTHSNLGNALAVAGKTGEAVEHYRKALRLQPDSFESHNNLAAVLANIGSSDEAIEHYHEALRLKPDYPVVHYNLAVLLAKVGSASKAREHYHQALRLKPDFADAHNNLAALLAAVGKAGEAIEHYHQVLRLLPDSIPSLNNLAWLLATHEPAEGGDPARAVQLAERARELGGQENAPCLDTLAAAYAAADRLADAVLIAEQAAQLAESAGQTALAKNIRSRLELYRAGQPYREKPASPAIPPQIAP